MLHFTICTAVVSLLLWSPVNGQSSITVGVLPTGPNTNTITAVSTTVYTPVTSYSLTTTLTTLPPSVVTSTNVVVATTSVNP
ncbi:hypothetical protein K493DRAFT_319471 [Basidiobolus meristosporus CBS 931.73]|uniref:REJ domain-containing protein n=1 Tax=Basidiobolus meristosporus CBS 931.73 TaxID=1314790 RepID=A0A1Y1XRL2_9FUNG|nr:hypothetical protein K493DRAFT_319471 [Basidiobolus meristosporus CBS 931.73]|eukprot:ORX88409.1 hypothetical protein K493DRAFT_319471 [Basidiobolus meristosporus CBS 931.73]